MNGVEASICPAGKGINVARVIKELGEDVCVAGVIHENNYAQFTHYLDGLGIASHFCVIPASPINITLLEMPAVRQRISTAFSRCCLQVFRTSCLPISPHISKPATCASVPQSAGRIAADFYMNLIKISRYAGAETLLDSSGEALRMGVRSKPIMVNRTLWSLKIYLMKKCRGSSYCAERQASC